MNGYPEMNGNGKITPKDLTTVYRVNPWEGRNLFVCHCCLNNLREACFEVCQVRRDYSKLEPKPLEEVTMPMPRFKDTLSWSAIEKWAFTYLSLFYAREEKKQTNEPIYRW